MPKKRASLHYTKPATPVHPSLSSSSAYRDGSNSLNTSEPSTEKSVNQLIQDIRIGHAPPAPKEHPQGPLNPQTVHPSLASILQVPNTPPPRPRPGMSAARGIRGRGPAGPPPPSSWLEQSRFLNDSMYAPARMRNKKQDLQVPQTIYVAKGRLGGLPDQYFPDESSLIHKTLQALAKNWVWHVQYDQFYLATLPMRYKQALLSYIAFYSPQSLTYHDLDVLFLDSSELENATGSEGLTHLDLATFIGLSLNLNELKDFFKKKQKTSITSNGESIPDSWEIPSIAHLPSVSRFSSLTHLSLAHPVAGSWRSLLAFAPHLVTLTHLSLADWPVPTLTPNSQTAYRTTPRGDVDYGASNFYSIFDCDFSEAAGVLRRLSRSLLCLKWLDLTGCGEWIRALGTDTGIDWNGAWRGVEIVKVGTERDVPEYVRDGTGRWKHLWTDRGQEYLSVEKLRMRRALKMWVEFEKNVKIVEEEVAHIVAQGGKGPVGGHVSSDDGNRIGRPGTWWDQGSNARPEGPKVGQRSCRVKFERGWKEWEIEDALRQMGQRGIT